MFRLHPNPPDLSLLDPGDCIGGCQMRVRQGERLCWPPTVVDCQNGGRINTHSRRPFFPHCIHRFRRIDQCPVHIEQHGSTVERGLPPENCRPNRESQSANNHQPHGPWKADRVGREPDKWRADQEPGIPYPSYDSQPSAVEGGPCGGPEQQRDHVRDSQAGQCTVSHHPDGSAPHES